jgi:hypothetical protein
MTPAILLITTSLYGQPASNSETRFESMEDCQDARTKLMTDTQNLRDKAQAAEVMRARPSRDQPTPRHRHRFQWCQPYACSNEWPGFASGKQASWSVTCYRRVPTSRRRDVVPFSHSWRIVMAAHASVQRDLQVGRVAFGTARPHATQARGRHHALLQGEHIHATARAVVETGRQ